MMDTKKVNSALTRMVDKFTSTFVQYENGLSTETALKKNACDHLAVLIRLKEAENLAVEKLIEGFTGIITAEQDSVNEKANAVCGDLYDMINQFDD